MESQIPEEKETFLSNPFFSELFSSLGSSASKELFKEKEACLIETELLGSFPRPYSLKVYRGLPRLYRKESPQESKIKPEFSDVGRLKLLCLEKFLLPLTTEEPPPSKVTLFSWVISDGWGDLIAAREVLLLLSNRFPQLAIDWIAIVPESYGILKGPSRTITYREEIPFVSQEILEILRSSDLILSLPTYYPKTPELIEAIQNIPGSNSPPRFLCLGQYGYLESSWFHPASNHRSMGLHFLEKGVLLRTPFYPDFSRLENPKLKEALFGTTLPTPIDIERYLETHQFFLAYLVSPIGGAIYLHALLKWQAKQTGPIDLYTPDLGWFIAYLEQQRKLQRPVLEGNFHIQSIEVHYADKVYRASLASEGKRLRIFALGPLSDGDFRLLMRLSGDFVGIRGDQSFSEAVSADRLFFYDGAPHARYFLKDLMALAENRLSSYRSTLSIFRGMGKAFLHQLKQEEAGEWVEESYFQEAEGWTAIANQIGNALSHPETPFGFRHFNRIIKEEHGANAFLIDWVRKELLYRQDPPQLSRDLFLQKQFVEGKLSLGEILRSLGGLPTYK